MKKEQKVGILMAVSVVIAAVLIPAKGISKNSRTPQNILDYYLELPEDYFYCEIKPGKIDDQFKKKQIIKQNIKNGYILAKSEDYKIQVVLFTERHLGITVIAVNRPCQPGCMCNLFAMLQYRNGKWLSFDSFPSEDEIREAAKLGGDDSYELVLPEFGVDIKVINPETGKTLLLITWSGGQFFIKK